MSDTDLSSGSPPIPPTSTAPTHSVAMLTLGAIGVVFGDIGTSPLYAFREAVMASGASPGLVPHKAVIGVASLILWGLVVIVSVKYVTILLRADNDGEGGILSLLALAQRGAKRPETAIILLGILGAALFYGDALITPAISVLSAVEGLQLIRPGLEPFILPLACAVIAGLFAIQRKGTDAVARFFGPVMALWFIVLAAGGLWQILRTPAILAAFNPLPAGVFLLDHPAVALAILGAVFLAVTGAEALYADMGHFGRRPIRLGWFVVAFPSLVLNYLGQGALLLLHPEMLGNPFYLMFPGWALTPLVILATLATVIASQAVITGAFSLTQQAVQLKLLPRMNIRYTSEANAGQIYLPTVNMLLAIGVIALVLLFGSSSALASAYGISVTGTMVITAILAMIVAHRHWGWSIAASVALMAPFLCLDLTFLTANLTKIAQGGFLPLLVAATMMVLMWSWRRGSARVQERDREAAVMLDALLPKLEGGSVGLISGTAVFLTATPQVSPIALLHSLKHFKVLHEQNLILTIKTADVPHIADADRLSIAPIAPRFLKVTLTYGYAEAPDAPKALLLLRRQGVRFDVMATSFILSRRRLRLAVKGAMPRWQARIFIYLSRNSTSASDYFRIPAGRVVEIGTQMNI